MPNIAAIDPKSTPISIMAEGYLDTPHAKIASGILRYGNWNVQSVIDSKSAGKTIFDVTGIKHSASIVSSLNEAMNLNPAPKALVLGITPIGGKLPLEWRNMIKEALKQGLHIINGLHIFLTEDRELMQLAEANNVYLFDLRDPNLYPASQVQEVAKQRQRPDGVKLITMVGSDCNVGKMFSALELTKAARAKGIKASFIATGQTGIIINTRGVPLDRVIGDFMAGAMENEIFSVIESEKPELIFVEGQGSLIHPAYSGVTLSLLHGSNPDGMILCHKSNRNIVNGGYRVQIPSYSNLIAMYESAATWIRNEEGGAKVLGISLNSSALSDADAGLAIEAARSETKLAVTDPVRFGVDELIEQILNCEVRTCK